MGRNQTHLSTQTRKQENFSPPRTGVAKVLLTKMQILIQPQWAKTNVRVQTDILKSEWALGRDRR